jgi:hypothetical protein
LISVTFHDRDSMHLCDLHVCVKIIWHSRVAVSVRGWSLPTVVTASDGRVVAICSPLRLLPVAGAAPGSREAACLVAAGGSVAAVAVPVLEAAVGSLAAAWLVAEVEQARVAEQAAASAAGGVGARLPWRIGGYGGCPGGAVLRPVATVGGG